MRDELNGIPFDVFFSIDARRKCAFRCIHSPSAPTFHYRTSNKKYADFEISRIDGIAAMSFSGFWDVCLFKLLQVSMHIKIYFSTDPHTTCNSLSCCFSIECARIFIAISIIISSLGNAVSEVEHGAF